MIYIFVLSTCFVCYVRTWRNNVLTILLGLSLFTELIVNISWYILNTNYHAIYKLYIPFELAIVLVWFNNQKIKLLSSRLLSRLFIGYIVTSMLYYLLVAESWEAFPGGLYNLSGLIIIFCAMVYLFSVHAHSTSDLLNKGAFWIALSFILFYTGIFTTNLVYNYFDISSSDISRNLRVYLTKSFNIVFYLMLIFGAWVNWTQRKPFLA